MEKINVWGETVLTIMTTLWGKIAGFVPNLAGAILLLLVGYFVAKAIGFLLTKALQRAGFNEISEKVGVAGALGRANIELSAAHIIGKIIFWIILLTFLMTALETLGLPRVSGTLDEFLLYLPRVIAAALILVIGLFVAHYLRDLVRGGAEGIGVEYAGSLGNVAYGLIFIIIVSLAIGQLEINTSLLNTVISIFIATIGIAAALSLGLGTRELASNILAGIYARELYQPGAAIELDDIVGTLERIGTVKTHIKLKQKKTVSIANCVLINSRVISKNK